MCTAISFLTKDHYFGRNLDLEYSYNERVMITPRNYPFHYRMLPKAESHYAMIGMAIEAQGYPLYFDATNEHGLSIAGLNFPGNAVYMEPDNTKDNIAPFELIPWLLGHCKTVLEAQKRLEQINIADIPFSDEYLLTHLHWIASDRFRSIVIEPMAEGLKIHDNPVGLLTNNPPFDYQLLNLCNFMNLTHNPPTNRFSDKITLAPYSRGLGAYGLPGDLSSASRFTKAAFTKLNSVCNSDEMSSVSQFFHILGAVEQQSGCVKVGDKFEKTVYTSCCNTDKGIYYYTTYDNRQISAVKLFAENLDSNALISYPLITSQQIYCHNDRIPSRR